MITHLVFTAGMGALLGFWRGSQSSNPQAPPSGGPRALGAPPRAWRGGAGSPRGSLEEVVSLGDCWVNHEASSRDCHAGGTRAGRSARAVRDARLGGKVRTSRLQQRVCDAVLFMRDLSAGSLLRLSRLMGGWGWAGTVSSSPELPHPSSQFCPELTLSRESFPPDPPT